MEHRDLFATILDVRLSMVLKSAMAPAPETPKGIFKIKVLQLFFSPQTVDKMFCFKCRPNYHVRFSS